MHDLAGVELTFGSFPTLLALCVADPAFPRTEDAWERLVASETVEASKEALGVLSTHIDPDRFARWCKLVNVVPCLNAMRAYSIVHKLPRGTQHYGPMSLDSDFAPLTL